MATQAELNALSAATVPLATYNLQALVPRTLVTPAKANAVMATPPTVGALATSSAISGGVTIPCTPVTAVANSVINLTKYSYLGLGLVQYGTVTPDFFYVGARYNTDPNSPANNPAAVEFMHYGLVLEVTFKGLVNKVRIKVDGEYVTAAAVVVTATGSTYYLPVTFASLAWRRITIEMHNFVFGGVVIGATDSIRPVPAPTRDPLVIVHGDSFSEASGGSYSEQAWWRTTANVLGWRKVVSTSQGGTGWLTTGPAARPTLRGRFATDIYPYAPDLLILAAGHNDTAQTQNAIQTEVAAALAALAANVPNTKVIVISPFWHGGVESMASIWPIRDGIKAACAAAGVTFIDVLEGPMSPGTPQVSTLAASSIIGATSISTVAQFARRTTIQVGAERRVVNTCAGSGPYTLALTSALSAAHTSGDAVTEVGAALWTGSGHVGALAGSGNSDVMVGADGTHPTQAGSDMIGFALAEMISAALAA